MSERIINQQMLDRIEGLFPCVIWKDYTAKNGKRVFLDDGRKKKSNKDGCCAPGYFDKNTDRLFYDELVNLVRTSRSDLDLIKAFYDFKNNYGLSDSRKKIFDYLLPPENEFLGISNIQKMASIGDIYMFFNQYFVEEKFNNNLAKKIPVQLVPEGGGLYKEYTSKDWVCYYNNDGPRFTWEKNIDWKNFGYSPNNPWEGFEHYCQYRYTLVYVGYEKILSAVKELNKTDSWKKGLEFLYNKFELESKRKDYNSKQRKSVDYEESDYVCLMGNINYGIERTKTKKDVFYIKNFKETELEINTAKKHCKYEKKSGFFTLPEIDNKTKIRILEKYRSKMSPNELDSCSSDEEKLNKILTFIEENNGNKEDKKCILKLMKKIKSKSRVSISDVGERNLGSHDEDGKKDEKIRIICNEFSNRFPKKEVKFKEWIKESTETYEKRCHFFSELTKLYDEDPECAIVKKYAELYKNENSAMSYIKTKFDEAIKKIQGE